MNPHSREAESKISGSTTSAKLKLVNKYLFLWKCELAEGFFLHVLSESDVI